MYDVTDRGSFNSIRNWVGQIQQVRTLMSSMQGHYTFTFRAFRSTPTCMLTKFSLATSATWTTTGYVSGTPTGKRLTGQYARGRVITRPCLQVVSVEEGKQLAKEYGIQFYETSAKNDIEVETVIYHCAWICCQRPVTPPIRQQTIQGFTTVAREVKNRLLADGPRPNKPNDKDKKVLSGAKPAAKAGCC